MTEHKIVFLDRDTLGPKIEIPSPNFAHSWTCHDQTRNNDAVRKLKDATIAITNKIKFDFEIIKQLPNLKHIAIASHDTSSIDLAAAKVLNVSVSKVPSLAVTSVAEHTFAMMLGLRRNIAAYQRDIVIGKWQASQQFCFYNDPIHNLRNATLGIVGTGEIAVEVSRLAQAFGMNVIFYSVSGRQDFKGGEMVTFEELLAYSDVISVHCEANEKSKMLFNSDTFKKMKADAILINTAQGDVVDLDALRLVLQRKGIAGAAIDVAPVEPPMKSHSIMYLNQIHNCIVTPHTAWASIESQQAVANQLIENINAFAAGQELNIVN